MFYNPGTAQSVLNIPPNMKAGSFSLLIEPNGAYGNGCKQTITDNYQGITDTRVMSDVGPGHWSEWKTLATATPPQEFSLPLADGIGGSARYIKTQESIVYIFGWITGAQLESEIAILPEGFRPKYNVVATTSASSNDTTNNSVRIRFSTDGRIVAEKADDTNALKNGLSIVGCFLANNS